MVGLESLIPDLVDILLSPSRLVFIENLFVCEALNWSTLIHLILRVKFSLAI